MKNKQIIIDYKEYVELLNTIKKEEDLLRKLYDNATDEQKRKIEDIMTFINHYC